MPEHFNHFPSSSANPDNSSTPLTANSLFDSSNSLLASLGTPPQSDPLNLLLLQLVYALWWLTHCYLLCWCAEEDLRGFSVITANTSMDIQALGEGVLPTAATTPLCFTKLCREADLSGFLCSGDVTTTFIFMLKSLHCRCHCTHFIHKTLAMRRLSAKEINNNFTSVSLAHSPVEIHSFRYVFNIWKYPVFFQCLIVVIGSDSENHFKHLVVTHNVHVISSSNATWTKCVNVRC